jgi:hypothetical protein
VLCVKKEKILCLKQLTSVLHNNICDDRFFFVHRQTFISFHAERAAVNFLRNIASKDKFLSKIETSFHIMHHRKRISIDAQGATNYDEVVTFKDKPINSFRRRLVVDGF